MNFREAKAETAEVLMNAILEAAEDKAYRTPESLADLARAFADVSAYGQNKPTGEKRPMHGFVG